MQTKGLITGSITINREGILFEEALVHIPSHEDRMKRLNNKYQYADLVMHSLGCNKREDLLPVGEDDFEFKLNNHIRFLGS